MKNAVMHFKQCNGTDSHYSSSYWGKSCTSNFTCFYYLFQPQADHSRVDDDDDDGDDGDNNDDDDDDNDDDHSHNGGDGFRLCVSLKGATLLQGVHHTLGVKAAYRHNFE